MIPSDDIDRVLGYALPYIQQHVTQQREQQSKRTPFILALTGLQGSGKTTWTSGLVRLLNDKYNLRTINVSLDDFYLPHDDLVQLRESNPGNKLLQMRGQPGTHDTALARDFLDSLPPPAEDLPSEILIPAFDKSQFHGEGDRIPRTNWQRVHISSTSGIDVLVLEGWCVGFQPLDEATIERKWQEARHQPVEEDAGLSTRTLRDHPLSSVLQINENLKTYCDLFLGPRHLDFLLHLDTDDLANVYRWRLQQEHALHRTKNEGMTDDEVVAFVKGYMPAYELYLDSVRAGIFNSLSVEEQARKGQLRVILDRKRRIVDVVMYR
ncbi:P-loop containing nucleoside triphosphate hydrolase protein [Aspergillus sclerotiicarbonarius CBS 121057]|uniref:P-loop containing nucleoside triphosphate hydrolase protein n=1 Tax=Aspergillus sclerotiicarbonarius (strain CBS 121057 / IBT 28362) TaxID=1448318 RepID=A0A319EGX8_ASPSB|nr:P-loop containing nucleoside triphosphate hydrolase protein [Aspergillus sclerotiicarbonarius CBS 121057]